MEAPMGHGEAPVCRESATEGVRACPSYEEVSHGHNEGDVLRRLVQLAHLHEQGFLTDEAFQQMKIELRNRL